MSCPRCQGSRHVLVRVPERRSLAGYTQVAKPCPECRPLAYRLIEPDRKMQAAGDEA